MDKDFWNQRWQTSQIGFHTSSPHWALETHWPGLNLPAADTVLVPLCGKSLDMRWLRERGHPVTGIELNPIAVHDFFAEWQRPPQTAVPTQPALKGLEACGVRLWQGDFFAFQTEQPYRAFYDRAALIALPPEMRREYASKLRACLADGAIGLVVSLEYEQSQKDGPPFSVSFDEVSRIPGFDSEALERRDVLADSPNFQSRGISSLHETVYRLTAV